MENKINVIDPISKEKISSEIQDAKFLCLVGTIQIYYFKNSRCPNLMLEVGRLRELAFRGQGAGTGKAYDLDIYDDYFLQLIAYDPNTKSILGGYRFQVMQKLWKKKNKESIIMSPTNSLFQYSSEFIIQFIPHTLELGRSFIDKSNDLARKSGLYSLFKGICCYIKQNSNIKYLFGKITFYPSITDKKLMDTFYVFMDYYFGSRSRHPLISPIQELSVSFDRQVRTEIVDNFSTDLEKDLRAIKKIAPPLLSIYSLMNPKTFGTARNLDFGKTEETAILVNIQNISEKYKRFYGLLA